MNKLIKPHRVSFTLPFIYSFKSCPFLTLWSEWNTAKQFPGRQSPSCSCLIVFFAQKRTTFVTWRFCNFLRFQLHMEDFTFQVICIYFSPQSHFLIFRQIRLVRRKRKPSDSERSWWEDSWCLKVLFIIHADKTHSCTGALHTALFYCRVEFGAVLSSSLYVYYLIIHIPYIKRDETHW